MLTLTERLPSGPHFEPPSLKKTKWGGPQISPVAQSLTRAHPLCERPREPRAEPGPPPGRLEASSLKSRLVQAREFPGENSKEQWTDCELKDQEPGPALPLTKYMMH
ncbi:uncharacterized protein LOC114678372 isoform X2 [Macaca mulatta]